MMKLPIEVWVCNQLDYRDLWLSHVGKWTFKDQCVDWDEGRCEMTNKPCDARKAVLQWAEDTIVKSVGGKDVEFPTQNIVNRAEEE